MIDYNLIKTIVASTSVIIALVAGFIELRLNPDNWLNRWFALFFISTAMAFFIYAFYHLVNTGEFYTTQAIVIPMLITAHFLFSFAVICLVMTVFILEMYKKIALNYKHLGLMMVLLIIMIIGYFILVPTLNRTSYDDDHIIDTDTLFPLHIFVNFLRLGLLFYVIFKYSIITRKVEEDTKKRIQWFIAGVIIITIGIVINLLGGFIKEPLVEIFALVLLDVGIFVIVKGFLI